MSLKSIYQYVNIYRIEAKCKTPLHVGSSDGDKGEILIHPVKGIPFIQATGLAGAFREYIRNTMGEDVTSKWFGDSNVESTKNRDDFRSNIVFTDANFVDDRFKMEMRTRVKLNPETGSTDTKKVGGKKSGQLLQTEYITKDSVMTFNIFEYFQDKEEKCVVQECLRALNHGEILLGGQLSNGCGEISLNKVQLLKCNMREEKDRQTYRNMEEELKKKVFGEDITAEVNKAGDVAGTILDFIMDVNFDHSVLVKGDEVNQEILEEAMGIMIKDNERLPDKMQLMDGNGDFVVPGSSIKGVFRNRMEMIASYKGNGLKEDLIPAIFEDRSHMYFYDAFLEKKVNRNVRIHIDKFTGSVMDKSLFQEAVNAGKSQIRVKITGEKESMGWTSLKVKQAAALLLLTMRDCAVRAINIGSGYSVGNGFMTVNNITVTDGHDTLISIDMNNKISKVDNDLVKEWLMSLDQQEDK